MVVLVPCLLTHKSPSLSPCPCMCLCLSPCQSPKPKFMSEPEPMPKSTPGSMHLSGPKSIPMPKPIPRPKDNVVGMPLGCGSVMDLPLATSLQQVQCARCSF